MSQIKHLKKALVRKGVAKPALKLALGSPNTPSVDAAVGKP
jgi:hypothetical protein